MGDMAGKVQGAKQKQLNRGRWMNQPAPAVFLVRQKGGRLEWPLFLPHGSWVLLSWERRDGDAGGGADGEAGDEVAEGVGDKRQQNGNDDGGDEDEEGNDAEVPAEGGWDLFGALRGGSQCAKAAITGSL